MKKIAMLVIFAIILSSFTSILGYGAEVKHDPYVGLELTQPDEVKNDPNGTVGFNEDGYVSNLASNQYLVFKNVDFGKTGSQIANLVVSTGGSYVGDVVFYLDGTKGTPFGTFKTVDTKWGTPATVTCELSSAITGVHDIYLTNKTGYSNLYKLSFTEDVPKSVAGGSKVVDTKYTDLDGNPFKDSIYTLNSLGLLTGITESIYEPQLAVTRSEFANIIFNIMCGTDYTASDSPFVDVPLDHEAANAVSYLLKNEIVKMPENKHFNPYSYIQTVDALAMCLRVLGFESIVNHKGGYPVGVLEVANKEKLTAGLSMSTYLRRDELAGMIENMLDADYLDVQAIGTDGDVEYERKSGILSLTRGIERGIGVISANPITTLDMPKSNVPENCIVINDEVYNVGKTDAQSLFGHNVKFFYTTKENKKEIIAVRLHNEGKLVDIDTSNGGYVDVLTEDKLIYYEPDDNKQNKIILKKNTAFVYNGKAIDAPLASIMDEGEFKGRITYIENPERAVVLIEQYKNIVVQSMDVIGNILVDNLTGDVYNLDPNENVIEIFKGTEPKDINSIVSGNVATVYASKNTTGEKYYKILVGNYIKNGTITMIEDDKIYIDDEEFFVSGDCKKAINVGLTAAFSFNLYRELVTYSSVHASEGNVAVLIDYQKTKLSGFDSSFEIKVYNKDDMSVILPLAESLTIDGVKCKTFEEKLYGKNAYKGLTDDLKNTLVAYDTNENGQIVMLDTCHKGAINSNDTLRRLTEEGPVEMSFVSSNGMLVSVDDKGAGLFPYTTAPETFFFETTDDPETLSYGGPYTRAVGESFQSDAYTLDNENPFVQYMIVQGRTTSNRFGQPLVFDKIVSTVTEDGEKKYNVILASSSGTKTYAVTEKGLESNPNLERILKSVLKKGDIVQFKTNQNSEINQIQVVMFRDGATERDGLTALLAKDKNGIYTGSSSSPYQQKRYIYATVVAKHGQFLEVKPETAADGTEFMNEYCKVPTKGVAYFDYNGGRDILMSSVSIDNVAIGDKILSFTDEYRTSNVVKMNHPSLND